MIKIVVTHELSCETVDALKQFAAASTNVESSQKLDEILAILKTDNAKTQKTIDALAARLNKSTAGVEEQLETIKPTGEQ